MWVLQFIIVKLQNQVDYLQMEQDRFKKARLTIQECSFPSREISQNISPKQRYSSNIMHISFFSHSNSLDKKSQDGSPDNEHYLKMARMLKSDRRSEPKELYKNERASTLIDLPQIRAKTKTNRGSLEPMKSYSSTKLSVGPYRKLGGLYSSRYSTKMESLKKIEPSHAKRLITISEFNGPDIANPLKPTAKPKKGKQLAFLKGKIMKHSCKNHLNRVSNDLAIPQELQSRKCEYKQYNNDVFNLRLKNMLRFEFDPAQESKINSKRGQDISLGMIEGWRQEIDHFQTSGLYLS